VLRKFSADVSDGSATFMPVSYGFITFSIKDSSHLYFMRFYLHNRLLNRAKLCHMETYVILC